MIDKSIRQHYEVTAPRKKKVKGQLHKLAYITDKEAKLLQKFGGQKVMTPEKIPAYPPPGERGGPGSGSEGRSPGGGGGGGGGGGEAAMAANIAAAAASSRAAAAEAAAKSKRDMQATIAQAEKAEANRVSQLGREGKIDVGFQEAKKKEMQDLIIQQQLEKDYIDIIDKNPPPITAGGPPNLDLVLDESPRPTLQGQLKLDEYQKPNTGIDKLIGAGLNVILPGSGYLYNLPSNPYKASNFFQGTGIQNLDQNALLSGSVSPEDAAAYRAGTYGQPTTTGGDGQPTTGGDNQPIIGGGGQDVMPITPSYVNPTGIASIPMDNQTTSGYDEQQDFVDNTYRQNLLDFFKGTGYKGLYG